MALSDFLIPDLDNEDEENAKESLYYFVYLGIISFIGILNIFQTLFVFGSFIQFRFQKKSEKEITESAVNVGDEFYYFEAEYKL